MLFLARAPQPDTEFSSNSVNSFDYVEKLILPNWGKDRCPWCAESDWFTAIRRQQSIELREPAEGMDQNIFITPSGQGPLSLKKDSFIGPPSLAQSNIFCVIAGTLQRLRTEHVDGTPLLDDQYFLIKPVLDKSCYMTFFTDSVLVAAILRAAMADELVYVNADREKDRTDMVLKNLKEKTTGELEYEINFAKSLGKFPEL